MRPLALLLLLSTAILGHAETKPLKALLVAGGCCHDYAKQHVILSQGIQARANVQVDVVWTDDKSVMPPLPLYDNPDWAKGYDIIIHDECAAGVKDMALVKRILDVHQTIPAVHLHCAMHSFRTGTDAWFKHLGIQSASHGPQEPIAITFVDKEHPRHRGGCTLPRSRHTRPTVGHGQAVAGVPHALQRRKQDHLCGRQARGSTEATRAAEGWPAREGQRQQRGEGQEQLRLESRGWR
ncbi:hypothetical protein [Prosthecobacter sp.]|uniref:hypothetical protein n=1 Tax=Prosthecobacter sp. TaxID=1965333 RepID=UPI0037842A89